MPSPPMDTLRPTTVLRRRSNLDLRLDSSHQVTIALGGVKVACGPHALAVLDAFAEPRTFAEALARLPVRGAQDWADATATIAQLHRAGVLCAPKAVDFDPDPAGFGSTSAHVRMLNDRRRTAAFLAAVAAVVRPGDVVVEIGTGSGVLAVAAARAGAARVYAVEASAMADLAAEVFARNGVADRVTLVRGWSTRIELPERADVLIGELIGNDPWGERVLEAYADARRRLLVPAPRLVPRRVAVCGLPVTVPATELADRLASARTVADWRSWYGVDLGPLADAGHDPERPLFHVRSAKAAAWTVVGEPLPLAEIDLGAFTDRVIDRTVAATATAAGRLDGLLVYFELELAPGITLSTHPAKAAADNHWASPVWVFAEPLTVAPGDRFGVHYTVGTGRHGTTVRLVDAP